MEATLGYILRCGEANLRVMSLLDHGHTSRSVFLSFFLGVLHFLT